MAENVPWSDNCLKLLQGIYKSPVYEKGGSNILLRVFDKSHKPNTLSLSHLPQIQAGQRLEKSAMERLVTLLADKGHRSVPTFVGCMTIRSTDIWERHEDNQENTIPRS